MSTDKKLFEAFPPADAAAWIAQTVKDLKGASLEETLYYTSDDGIVIHPFYTSSDTGAGNSKAPLFTHADWEVVEAVAVKLEDEANREILHALNNGATALSLHVTAKTNLPVLLQEVEIAYIGLHFVVAGNEYEFLQNLQAYLKEKGLAGSGLNISINADFINHLMVTGRWKESEEKDKENWRKTFAASGSLRTLCVDAIAYQHAGASVGYQLGCALAQAHEYISLLDPAQQPDSMQVNVAIGPDYFFEIAKLRALRKVFALLFETYGMKVSVYIHAVTSFRNHTVYDAYNNLLRGTTEAMAAITGGCNSLEIIPFDASFNEPNEFAERMSRNIQLILKSESYFDKTADVAAGSYFIETITEQIAERAWEYFKSIEQEGGLIQALKSGTIQREISSFATAEQQRFDEGTEILVGSNKFPNNKETMKDKLPFKEKYEETGDGEVVTPIETRRVATVNEQNRVATEN